MSAPKGEALGRLHEGLRQAALQAMVDGIQVEEVQFFWGASGLMQMRLTTQTPEDYPWVTWCSNSTADAPPPEVLQGELPF